MKLNQSQFIKNLVECARETYVKVYNMAIDGDFGDKEKLKRLDARVFKAVYSYKRPKKLYKMLIYVSGTIYNNEIIADPRVCYDLNILITIHRLRLYKAHKFIQFIEDRGHHKMIIPGIRYSHLNAIIEKILRGVKC